MQPFEPGQARKLTSAMPAPASVGLPPATETVEPFLMKAPPVGAFSVNAAGWVTSRVIVNSFSVWALRSVTVTRFAPGDTVLAFVHV